MSDETNRPTGRAADDELTPEEEAAADRARNDPELSGDQEKVAEHYREMTELGANTKGEGKIS
jgi:hypothetical protein